MRAQHIIFSVAHHQALLHVGNATQRPHACRNADDLLLREAVELCASHMIKKVGNAKMLKNAQGKGLWL